MRSKRTQDTLFEDYMYLEVVNSYCSLGEAEGSRHVRSGSASTESFTCQTRLIYIPYWARSKHSMLKRKEDSSLLSLLCAYPIYVAPSSMP